MQILDKLFAKKESGCLDKGIPISYGVSMNTGINNLRSVPMWDRSLSHAVG